MTCVQRVTRMEPQQQDTQQIILCNVFSPEQTLVRLIQFIMIADLFFFWKEFHLFLN